MLKHLVFVEFRERILSEKAFLFRIWEGKM